MMIKGRDEIGDLPGRHQDGVFYSVWRPTPEERDLITMGCDIEIAVMAEKMPPISLIIYQEENADADLSSMRSGNDHPAGAGLGAEGGGGSPRVTTGGPGPVPSDGLVDGATDGAGSEPGLAGGQPGGALEDLSGAEVQVGDLVQISDGQGAGLGGVVTYRSATGFGHVHLTIETEQGNVIKTLQEKVRKL